MALIYPFTMESYLHQDCAVGEFGISQDFQIKKRLMQPS